MFLVPLVPTGKDNPVFVQISMSCFVLREAGFSVFFVYFLRSPCL